MTLTVGRLTFGDEFDLTGVSQSKTGLGLAGTIMTTAASAFTVEQQVMGLGEIEGQILPVVWSDNSKVDGFYRMADVNTSTATLTGTVAQVPVSMSLVRVAADVLFESWLVGADVANDHGLTGVTFHAPPIGATLYHTSPDGYTTYVDRVGSDGTVATFYGDGEIDFARWVSTPAAWYAGACEVTVDSSLVTGLSAANTPSSWSLSNTLVKVSASATAGRLDVAVYDSGWQSKTFRVVVGSTTVTSWNHLSVLANTPEYAAVRLLGLDASNTPVVCDLSVRRGSLFVAGHVGLDDADNVTVRRETAEAGATLTGAVKAAVADANGNRYIVGSPESFTADTTNGGITATLVTRLPFFVGYIPNASSGNADTDLVAQYIGYVAERITPTVP